MEENYIDPENSSDEATEDDGSYLTLAALVGLGALAGAGIKTGVDKARRAIANRRQSRVVLNVVETTAKEKTNKKDRS